ncbi:MAG: PIG-L family deacetylase [Firmicutes bacterium]|nr:PIG-L family deacetylase [Bacillota bacterium]
MPLDILAVGAHPDDVELGAAASLAAAAQAGLRVGVLDLTRGERSTNGTPEERLKEAEAAAAVLGLAGRWNAGLPDRGLDGSPGQVRAVAEVIHREAPALLLAPWWGDRHPDHRAAARIVAEACFEAGLLDLRGEGPRRRPAAVLFYFINDTPGYDATPAGLPALPPPAEAGTLLLVPAAAHYETKRRAVAAHVSQFGGRPGDRPTSLNSGETMRRVEAREAYFGSLVGDAFAEGFVRLGPWRLSGLAALCEADADRML